MSGYYHRALHRVIPWMLVMAWFGVLPALAETQRESEARAYFSDRLLIDQNGQSLRFFSDLLRDRIVVVNVVFTHCEDACPLITKKLLDVSRTVGESFGKTVHFVSLSIDPDRDTPERMKAFAEKQGADLAGWHFVVGTPEDTKYILGQLGQWSEDENNHSTLLLVGRPSLAKWAKLAPHAIPAQILAKVDEMQRAQ